MIPDYYFLQPPNRRALGGSELLQEHERCIFDMRGRDTVL